MMKVLELHGQYFRVPNNIESKKEALEKKASHVILEQLDEKEVMEECYA